MRQGGLILAAGRVCVQRKKSRKKNQTRKIPPHQNTPRNSQQPGDRYHLETAREETRPTRYPILARFHKFRVCGNRPRTALAINTSREVNEARRLHTCSRPCAFEEKKTKKKKKIPPHPEHTTKSTAARRPRPPLDGLRRNMSHALAHTRPLP